MILYIDTSNNLTQIALFNKKGQVVDEIKWTGKNNQSEQLLKRINCLFEDNNISKSKLEKIVVISGPGSYTGLRVGVSTANALAFALNIPVYGPEKIKNINEYLNTFVISNKKDLFDVSVVPKYSNPPKITKPKTRK